ncbi:TonB-dependent receptor [Archangium violaceum]|uniref:TonB-dependent receptor n=1 Tax=Archangium violaceum TaxID=83451 RepID=UPI00193C4B43|nr:TonB-dependent receptor [Archangium violaceum]QRK07620.1 TonB-dependent receptor [Archangium violaceum]
MLSSRVASLAAIATVVSAVPALAQSSGESAPTPPEQAAPAASEQAVAEPEAPASMQTTVTARRPFTAASSSTVRDQDFLLRPRPRPADILQVVPGLYTVQHAGGGKANQYFLRGFDADHGTDVALFVDGVPVNMVSHGHGQGYADLNWIIPELIERVEVRKGPYFAQDGDFATAGAVNLVTRRNFESSQLTLGGGSFDTWRGMFIAAPDVEGWSPVVAGQVYGTNGPFLNPERLERYSLFTKVTRDLSARSSLSLAITSYGSGWNASGQIPLRAVNAGLMDRFGSVNDAEGGNSQRHSAYATWRTLTRDDGEVNIMAYGVQYRLNLYSDFTFFSRDPVNGDMIEQNDRRTVLGFNASYRFRRQWAGITFDTLVGTQLRSDSIENGLSYDKARERLETVVDASIRESSLGVYAQEDIVFTPWLRAVLGLRADSFGFDVNDHREDLSSLDTKTSGVRQASLLSPKASLVVSPLPSTELYVNFGDGFHSNDARGVVRQPDPVTPLTKARGYELGARTRLFDRLDLAGSVFRLDLDSELVWVGDEGSTEARGATRRQGLEAEARLKVLPWLFADADATFTRATYVQNAGNGDAVALAPTLILSGGVSARHPIGIYGRLGVLHLGDRPATEDGLLTAEGFTRVDATLGYRGSFYEVNLSVQNLLDTVWREAQFANVSRLPSETSPSSCPVGTRPAGEADAFEGCEDVHFTPGAPFNAQASVSFFF